MNNCIRAALLNALILWGNSLCSSILEGTLIKTSKGLVAVEAITTGDILIGRVENGMLLPVTVITISPVKIDKIVTLKTEKGEIHVAPDQLFYIFSPTEKNHAFHHKWITAQDITIGMSLLDSQHHEHKCLDVEYHDITPTKAYKIFVTFPHCFFISKQELLVHNFLPFLGLGATFLFGGGLELGGISLISSIAGLALGVTLFKKQSKPGRNFNITPIGGGGCNNNSPHNNENGERKFNVITKTVFFKKMKDQYKHWKGHIYKRINGAKGLDKKVEYVKWDHLHNDIEAFDRGGRHLGSYDPKTLQLYKPPKLSYTIDI